MLYWSLLANSQGIMSFPFHITHCMHAAVETQWSAHLKSLQWIIFIAMQFTYPWRQWHSGVWSEHLPPSSLSSPSSLLLPPPPPPSPLHFSPPLQSREEKQATFRNMGTTTSRTCSSCRWVLVCTLPVGESWCCLWPVAAVQIVDDERVNLEWIMNSNRIWCSSLETRSRVPSVALPGMISIAHGSTSQLFNCCTFPDMFGITLNWGTTAFSGVN